MIELQTSWYYAHKRIDTSYTYIEKEERSLDIQYEINAPAFFDNFQNDDRARALVDLLRENGFIVKVWSKNPDRLMGENEGGETCIGWGCGKQFGFSSHDNSLFGYSAGRELVLYAKFGEFNKWSDCAGIKKTASFEDILLRLMSNDEQD